MSLDFKFDLSHFWYPYTCTTLYTVVLYELHTHTLYFNGGGGGGWSEGFFRSEILAKGIFLGSMKDSGIF